MYGCTCSFSSRIHRKSCQVTGLSEPPLRWRAIWKLRPVSARRVGGGMTAPLRGNPGRRRAPRAHWRAPGRWLAAAPPAAPGLDRLGLGRRRRRLVDLLGDQRVGEGVLVLDDAVLHELRERHLERLHLLPLAGGDDVAQLVALALADQV